MKNFVILLILTVILTVIPPVGSFADTPAIQLGNDLLLSKFHHLLEGKKVGLVTNQTGVNSRGMSLIDLLRQDESVRLTALYAPEHGIDGKTPAGKYVSSYKHPVYGIPVYSLYGETRMPTREMLEPIDLLLFDIQDIGARSYTYISTLQYCMTAAKQYNKPIVVLDRPNPLGGTIVDGPVLEEKYRSFVGVDTLPMAHGMTIGELALYFNRNIGADVTVIPMEGYTRKMIFQDTGLPWIPTSPRIPTIQSAFGYMATGLGEGTGIVQADNFTWIGGKGIDAKRYAEMLNQAALPGVVFVPETKGAAGGVRLNIVNPHIFNPAKTGMYALAYAYQLRPFPVPKSGKTIVMFDKIMGTDQIGAALEQKRTIQQIELLYATKLAQFKQLREKYLIYGDEPYEVIRPIHDGPIVKPEKPSDPQPAVRPAPKPAAVVKPAGKPVAKPNTNPAKPNVQTKQPSGQAQGKPTAPPKPPADKVAYLTFDDGPSPVTRQVLDILKQHQVKATFFVVGKNIPGNEDVLKRAAAEGHVIGGHTFSHDYRIIYKDIPSFFHDLEEGNKLIEKAIGKKPVVFRFPGGSTNTVSKKVQDPLIYSKHKTVMEAIKAEAKKRGYRFIDWNVDSGDARSSHYTPESAVANVKQQAKNQREIVILMHDSAPKEATAKSLPAIIQHLKAEGYRFDVLEKTTPSVAMVK
jgi:uncharacterized protein YbbC (DUF1343 family)/peptidoglycan/xylan/chitin deacetylase (PgdA/CDA1 family)